MLDLLIRGGFVVDGTGVSENFTLSRGSAIRREPMPRKPPTESTA